MKKKFSLIVLAFVCLTGCQQKAVQQPVNPEPRATIVFLTDKTHDFGVYGTRDTVFFDFVFRNEGKVPFVVDRVIPSCGCLKVDYPKYPVQPGAVDSFHVAYDGNGFQSGFFTKRCDVYSNATDSIIYLRVQGTYSKTLEAQQQGNVDGN